MSYNQVKINSDREFSIPAKMAGDNDEMWMEWFESRNILFGQFVPTRESHYVKVQIRFRGLYYSFEFSHPEDAFEFRLRWL